MNNEYVIEINDEITKELTDKVVNELRQVYEYDKYLINTFVNPHKELINTVTINLDTPGGLVSGFTRIKTEVDKLKDLGVHIKTYVTNMAASCGFLILLLGDERDGSDFCMLMNHVSTTFDYGKVTSNQRMAEFNMEMENKYMEFVLERTNIDRDWMLGNVEVDRWFNYDDAVELGIFTKEEDNGLISLDEAIESFYASGYKIKEIEELDGQNEELKLKEDNTETLDNEEGEIKLSDMIEELSAAGYKVINDLEDPKETIKEEIEEQEDEEDLDEETEYEEEEEQEEVKTEYKPAKKFKKNQTL